MPALPLGIVLRIMLLMPLLMFAKRNEPTHPRLNRCPNLSTTARLHHVRVLTVRPNTHRIDKLFPFGRFSHK